jgi:hypothetical protein
MIYEITDLQKIGQGCSKIVFQISCYQNKVIKIMNPERVGSDGGWEGHGKIKRQLSQGVYKQFRRELHSIFNCVKTNISTISLSFLSKPLMALLKPVMV